MLKKLACKTAIYMTFQHEVRGNVRGTEFVFVFQTNKSLVWQPQNLTLYFVLKLSKKSQKTLKTNLL